jgi:putative endonuclease
MADHNDFGKLAEELAENFLVEKNYKILAKNYRYLKAEIDIIAQFENQIVIVEVKAELQMLLCCLKKRLTKRKSD